MTRAIILDGTPTAPPLGTTFIVTSVTEAATRMIFVMIGGTRGTTLTARRVTAIAAGAMRIGDGAMTGGARIFDPTGMKITGAMAGTPEDSSTGQTPVTKTQDRRIKSLSQERLFDLTASVYSRQHNAEPNPKGVSSAIFQKQCKCSLT